MSSNSEIESASTCTSTPEDTDSERSDDVGSRDGSDVQTSRSTSPFNPDYELRSPVLKKIALDIPLEEPFIDELKLKPSKHQVQLIMYRVQ